MLTPQERLEYCKYCTHSQKDEDGKWLCELTQQEPSFEYVCYDYNEKESRTKDIKENVEDEIRWYNGKVDYQQLNWNELEPEKEEMFCPGKETIERSFYLNSEIVALPINDVRWWVIDKIPGLDLSKQLKLIVKNKARTTDLTSVFFKGGVVLLLLFIFFASFIDSSIGLPFFFIFGFIIIGFIGKVLARLKDRPLYNCIEINRMDGLMKLPDDNFRYVVPFKHVHFHIKGGGNARTRTGLNLAMVLPFEKDSYAAWAPFFQRFFENKVIEGLSAMVWYMDKNRPLPPGKEFDAFRQVDFERRKAEGFPAPMYLSHIPTLEATAEQQAEREKYWKDKDYKVTNMTTRDVLIESYTDRGLKIPYSHLQLGITHKSYLGGMFTVKDNSKKSDKK